METWRKQARSKQIITLARQSRHVTYSGLRASTQMTSFPPKPELRHKDLLQGYRLDRVWALHYHVWCVSFVQKSSAFGWIHAECGKNREAPCIQGIPISLNTCLSHGKTIAFLWKFGRNKNRNKENVSKLWCSSSERYVLKTVTCLRKVEYPFTVTMKKYYIKM